jgi:hypothetical protein
MRTYDNVSKTNLVSSEGCGLFFKLSGSENKLLRWILEKHGIKSSYDAEPLWPEKKTSTNRIPGFL